MEGSLMSFPTDRLPSLNLEQQRKRAKDLRRAHREGHVEAAVRIARHLPSLSKLITLSEAQFVVAREAGFSSWPKMKHHIEQVALSRADVGEAIIDAAFAGNDNVVQSTLARDPGAAQRSIHVAAAIADVQAALSLLEADPSLVAQRSGRRNWTPLLYLCYSRYRRSDSEATAARLQIARRLIELGADVRAAGKELGYVSFNVNLFDQEEWFPIEAAAGQLGSPELVRLLLEAGADPKDAPIALSQAVRGGSSDVLRLLLDANHHEWQIIWALKACAVLDKKDMARILARHIAPPMATNEPALLEAIQLGRDAEFMDILIGDDHVPEFCGPIRQRAYRSALRYGNAVAADVLRRRGADAGVVSHVDRVIAACVAQDRAEVHRLLAKSSDFKTSLRDDDHRMLAWAVRSSHYNAVPLLLEAGLDPNVSDRDGETSLHLAVTANSTETVDVLLGAGADVEARNFDLMTPLDLAVDLKDDQSREQLIRHLLEAGAQPAQEEARLDREEMNLLIERAADAIASGELETLRELLDEEPSLVYARSPRPHRATLLNYCGANGVEAFRQRTPSNAPAIARLLLERGADVNATCNLYGGGATTAGLFLTSIHPVSAGVRTALFEVLLNAGAMIDGARGIAGISGAAAVGRLDIVKKCFEDATGVEPNITKAQVQSAFMWACEFGRTNIVAFLLDKGADVAAQNENGLTGLHLAALGGHLNAVELLLKRRSPLEIENVWGGTVLGNVLWAAVNYDANVDYVPVIETIISAGANVRPEFLTWWRKQNVLVPSAKSRIENLLASPIDDGV